MLSASAFPARNLLVRSILDGETSSGRADPDVAPEHLDRVLGKFLRHLAVSSLEVVERGFIHALPFSTLAIRTEGPLARADPIASHFMFPISSTVVSASPTSLGAGAMTEDGGAASRFPRRQLSDEVASYVRELIVSGRLRSGEFIRQEHIAEEL